jgi:hypothetical protein
MRKYNKRHFYPIIKYDPKYRANSGEYLKDEWTSYSAIGKQFDGAFLVREEYEKIEDLYVKAVFLTIDFFDSKKIKVNHILKLNNQKRAKLKDDIDLCKYLKLFETGNVIADRQIIAILLKLKLRDYICELELLIDGKSRSEIVFGFDYYMYLRTNQDVNPLLKKINKVGLFTK